MRPDISVITLGVDEVMREAAEAGAKILKPGTPTFWGRYSVELNLTDE